MMPGRPTTQELAHGDAAWLLSMTDLVSILLCFFIMLFSMSSVDTDKWQGLASADTTDQLAIVDQSESEPAAAKPLVPRASLANAADLGYLAAVIADKLASDRMLRGALIARSEDSLVIALPGQLLFAAGSAAPAPPARDALVSLSRILSMLDNRIEVRGHGDSMPVNNGMFASNWDLALARAASVAAIIREAGYSRAIVAFGQPEMPDDGNAVGPTGTRRPGFAHVIDIVIRPSATEAAS
ncbi:MAG TPA: flagellar motor protein MotB [Alphaproteobacteria bacterium]